MEFDLIQGAKRSAKSILSPIVDHLNDRFDWRTAMKGNPENYQYSLESLSSQEIELRRHLTEYVESWLAAGCDFKVWAQINKELNSRLLKMLNKMEFIILPDKRKRARLNSTNPSRNNNNNLGYREAAWLFVNFITSPFYDRISKCPSCNKYFFSIRGGKKKYCKRSCATGFTARQAMRHRREREQRQKLNRAKDAIEKLKTLTHQPEDVKGWVSQKTNVSKSWLTRAITRGELVFPETDGGKE